MEQQALSDAIKRQHETVRLAVAALAALIAFAETRGDHLVAVTIYALVPGAATLLLRLWMGEAQSVRDICVAAIAKVDADSRHIFENELRRTRDLSWYVALSFAVTGVVASVLALHEFQTGGYGWGWYVGFICYALVVLAPMIPVTLRGLRGLAS